MADKRACSNAGRSPEELAKRFADMAKTDPDLLRRVQEHWGAGDVQGARRIILDRIDDK
jgi:hypothetical protein